MLSPPRAGTPLPPAPPGWPETPFLTEAVCRAAFERATPLTVGIEDEVMLLHPETLDLAPAGPALLARVAGDPRFRREFPAAQLEVATPICADAGEVGRQVAAGRRALAALAGDEVCLAAAGTHPFAGVVGELSGGERYARLADEFRWAAPRAMVFGLHVHVAVPGADRALAVHNALRSYLPELAALAGNAPLLGGADTGLASVRPLLCGNLPRQGIPPVLASWGELVELVRWGWVGRSFPDAGQLWWELRPHLGYGTLEVRVPDAQSTPSECAAVAAVVQGLVAWLCARHDAGEPLPAHARVRIEENRWRALRHGLHGWMLDLETGRPEPTRARVERLLEAITPSAAALGSGPALADAADLVAASGADRQRALAEEVGLPGLVRRLAALFPG